VLFFCPSTDQEGTMRMKVLRLLVVAGIVALSTTTAPAIIHPDCSNQPNLACGMLCTQDGCAILVMPDPTDNHNYCYYVSGGGSGNCLGGTFHPCCE
jgi:hypothetical protein